MVFPEAIHNVAGTGGSARFDPSIRFLSGIRLDADQNHLVSARFSLSECMVDMFYERAIVREVMVRWKEGDDTVGVHPLQARQAVRDGWRSSMIERLD
jgi:hypothetical protein